MFHARYSIATLAVFATVLASDPSHAECPNVDATAVVVIPDIISETLPLPSGTTILPVVGVTYPAPTQIQQTITDFFEGVYPYYWWHLVDTIGSYGLWSAPAGDFGAVAIADLRSGDIVFAGHVVFAGGGHLAYPTVDTHTIAGTGTPAPAPKDVATFPNGNWGDWVWPETLEDLTDKAVGLLGDTDLFHSYAACGDYQVISYTYTPAVGSTDPYRAIQIILIDGKTNWIASVPTETVSWGHVKGTFR